MNLSDNRQLTRQTFARMETAAEARDMGMVQKLMGLSEAENKVCLLLISGLLPRKIGQRLGITRRGVHCIMQRIQTKCGTATGEEFGAIFRAKWMEAKSESNRLGVPVEDVLEAWTKLREEAEAAT